MITFEKMETEHRVEVIDIFNHYVENSFSAYPDQRYPYEAFDRLLEMTKGYPAFIIRSEGIVIGFCFLRPHSQHQTFGRCAEITYFIGPGHTGMNTGRLALELLETEAWKIGIEVLLASISSENSHSISFHLKNGFRECGRFEKAGMKFGRLFDEVWMQKFITPEGQ